MSSQPKAAGPVATVMAKAAREAAAKARTDAPPRPEPPASSYAPAAKPVRREPRAVARDPQPEIRTDIFHSPAGAAAKFSVSKLIAGVAQGLTFATAAVVLYKMAAGAEVMTAILWALLAILCQAMALTFFIIERSEKP